jgi:cell division protein FtsI/penicillin-binding protein 2
VAVQVISPDVARWLVETPLRQVVVRGTGRKADLPGIAVFGKSGTAQKPDPATGRPSNSLHVSSFVCGAPADNPRVLVLVTVDEPTRGGPDHYGGTVAAPAAAEILRQVLPLVP